MMAFSAVCTDAPDGRHSPEGDAHGDHFTCLWCHALLVFQSGRYVTEET
jgi:hypothetical protein